MCFNKLTYLLTYLLDPLPPSVPIANWPFHCCIWCQSSHSHTSILRTNYRVRYWVPVAYCRRTGTLFNINTAEDECKPFSTYRDVSTCRPQTLTDDQQRDLHSSLRPLPRESNQQNTQWTISPSLTVVYTGFNRRGCHKGQSNEHSKWEKIFRYYMQNFMIYWL